MDRHTHRRSLTLPVVLAVAGALAVLALPALAQFGSTDAPTTLAPPRPGKPDDSAPVVMTYLVGLVLAAAAIGVNLIPSKRGHQD
jgi:hypothetical protein